MRNLKNKFIAGVSITFVTKYIYVVFQIIISAILARLLSPEDFGIVAVVTVFVVFFQTLAQVGIGPAIIQNKSLNKNDIISIFYFTLIVGIVVSVAFGGFSYFIAYFYNDIKYVNIGWLLSISIFFYSLDIVPLSILRKKKLFLKIGLIEIIANIISGSIAIYLAIENFSYYSIVVRSILLGTFQFVFHFYYSNITLKIIFSLSSIKKIFNYSLFQFLFTIVNYFSRNFDNLLIGKCIGESALGYYDKAYNLMLYPVQNLTFVINPVLHPILSDYQNNKIKIYNAYKKVVRVLAILGIPISVLLFFSAKEVILIIYGDQWVNTIPAFKILSICIWVQVISSSSGSIFQASGSTKGLFIAGLLSSIFMIGGIGWGIINKSIITVSIGITIAFYINFIIVYFILIKIILKQTLLGFFSILIKPIIIGFAMSMALFFIKYNFDLIILNFTYKVSLSFIVFIIFLFLTGEYKIIKEFKRLE